LLDCTVHFSQKPLFTLREENLFWRFCYSPWWASIDLFDEGEPRQLKWFAMVTFRAGKFSIALCCTLTISIGLLLCRLIGDTFPLNLWQIKRSY
jgi:hypothetical protein